MDRFYFLLQFSGEPNAYLRLFETELTYNDLLFISLPKDVVNIILSYDVTRDKGEVGGVVMGRLLTMF